MKTEDDGTGVDHQIVLPEAVQDAPGQLVCAAREGLMARGNTTHRNGYRDRLWAIGAGVLPVCLLSTDWFGGAPSTAVDEA